MRAICSFISAAALAASIAPAQLEQRSSACALLSRLDVERATGIPVREGVPQLNTGTLTSCSFSAERGGRVTILVRRIPAANWSSEQIVRMTRGVRLGTWSDVHGIGARSFLYKLPHEGGVLCVFGGAYYLQVSMLRITEPSRAPAALEKLARHALVESLPAAQDHGRRTVPNNHLAAVVPRDRQFAVARRSHLRQ